MYLLGLLKVPDTLPSFMISARNVKITQTKGFMYDTELDSKGRIFQLSQIMVKNPCSLNPLRFAFES